MSLHILEGHGMLVIHHNCTIYVQTMGNENSNELTQKASEAVSLTDQTMAEEDSQMMIDPNAEFSTVDRRELSNLVNVNTEINNTELADIPESCNEPNLPNDSARSSKMSQPTCFNLSRHLTPEVVEGDFLRIILM